MCLGYTIFIKENAESVGRNGISRVAFRGWNDLVTQFLSGVREERWLKWNFASCFSRLKNVKKGQRSTTENRSTCYERLEKGS